MPEIEKRLYFVSADPVNSCGAQKVRSTVCIVYTFLRKMTLTISQMCCTTADTGVEASLHTVF